jgi:hypothetical protein
MRALATTVRAFAAALALAFAGMAAGQQPAPVVKPAAKPAAKPNAKAAELAREPRAMEILKATSARLAAARTMSFTATATYEYPSQLGPAIAYTTRTEVVMQRPDKLRVITVADGPASEFYYDGRVMVAYAPAEHLAAVANAPPTIDGALKAAYEGAAIYFPFTDLVLADPYAALTEGVKLAFYVGQSKVVGGVVTDMVVFATDDVFIQAWIGAEDRLPRRLRAVYRADPQRLRHQVDLADWRLDAPVAADVFASAKAAGAPRIAFARPEIPKQPPNMKPPALKPAKPAPKS